jgi:hypothetical protein
MLNPNMTSAWLLSRWARIYVGEPDKAVEHFSRAMRLTPLDPLFYRMHTGTAAAHSLLAVMTRLHCRHKLLCGCIQMIYRHYALLQQATRLPGMSQKRKKPVSRVRQLDPTSRLSRVAQFAPFRHLKDVSGYSDGLRKVGLPE